MVVKRLQKGSSLCKGAAPQHTGHTGQGGHCSADTSSELLRNQPSITTMEELARSLMESLDITELCLALLGQLKGKQPSQAPVFCGAVRSCVVQEVFLQDEVLWSGSVGMPVRDVMASR